MEERKTVWGPWKSQCSPIYEMCPLDLTDWLQTGNSQEAGTVPENPLCSKAWPRTWHALGSANRAH